MGSEYLENQTKFHTLEFDECQVLAKAHNVRNKSEYQEYLRHDEKLLKAVIEIALELLEELDALLD